MIGDMFMNAVQVFLNKTLDHLHSKGVQIEEVIEWTDQASNQYKSWNAFFQLTVSNLLITHNNFGVKHGKGPSDRAGAHFKNFVTGVVKSKKALLVTVEELPSTPQIMITKLIAMVTMSVTKTVKELIKCITYWKLFTCSTQFQGKSSNTPSHTKVHEKFILYKIQALRGLSKNVTCRVVALIAYLVQTIAFFQSMLTSGH